MSGRADRISKCQHSYVKLLCQITSKNSKKHGSSSRPFGGSLLFLLFGELAAGSSSLIHYDICGFRNFEVYSISSPWQTYPIHNIPAMLCASLAFFLHRIHSSDYKKRCLHLFHSLWSEHCSQAQAQEPVIHI